MQSHADPSRNYLKQSLLDPKRAELDQQFYGNFTDLLWEIYGRMFKFILRKNDVFGIQTKFFHSFNVLLNFLAEK